MKGLDDNGEFNGAPYWQSEGSYLIYSLGNGRWAMGPSLNLGGYTAVGSGGTSTAPATSGWKVYKQGSTGFEEDGVQIKLTC